MSEVANRLANLAGCARLLGRCLVLGQRITRTKGDAVPDAQRNHKGPLEAAEEIFALDGVMVPIDIRWPREPVWVSARCILTSPPRSLSTKPLC